MLRWLPPVRSRRRKRREVRSTCRKPARKHGSPCLRAGFSQKSKGRPGRAPAGPPEQIGENERGTAGQQHRADQDGAVAEKFLRHDQDDLIRDRIKEPVVLAGEEDGVEDHKGPLKIQGGQAPHHRHQPGGQDARPEAGTPSQGTVEAELSVQPQPQQQRCV